MSKKITITCDVIGCGNEATHIVDCCWGWDIDDAQGHYKTLEKPIKEQETDLCDKHWKEWSKLTCKLLKMVKERK